LPPFPVCPVYLGRFYIRSLPALAATAKQHYNRVAVPSAVQPITGAYVDTHFKHALPDRCHITEVPVFQLAQTNTNTNTNTSLSCLIAQAIEPCAKRNVHIIRRVSKEIFPSHHLVDKDATLKRMLGRPPEST